MTILTSMTCIRHQYDATKLTILSPSINSLPEWYAKVIFSYKHKLIDAFNCPGKVHTGKKQE